MWLLMRLQYDGRFRRFRNSSWRGAGVLVGWWGVELRWLAGISQASADGVGALYI